MSFSCSISEILPILASEDPYTILLPMSVTANLFEVIRKIRQLYSLSVVGQAYCRSV